jgi:hypothetical protein
VDAVSGSAVGKLTREITSFLLEENGLQKDLPESAEQI